MAWTRCSRSCRCRQASRWRPCPSRALATQDCWPYASSPPPTPRCCRRCLISKETWPSRPATRTLLCKPVCPDLEYPDPSGQDYRVSLQLHWFLPTSGDGRGVTGGGISRTDPTTQSTYRPPDIDYLAQVARAAEQQGFSGVLTSAGSG